MSGSTLIQSYTLNRNILGSSVLRSSQRIAHYIDTVGEGINASEYSKLSKAETNDISAIATNTGLFRAQPDGGYAPTKLNHHYRTIQSQNRADAWQWLLTRSLWHQLVPNGTANRYNAMARAAGVQFALFRTVLAILQLLAALPGDSRFLSFLELVEILKDDENWGRPSVELFNKVILLRGANKARSDRTFLDDLEDEVKAPRDNLNTVFVKAYRQTGLFSYAQSRNAVTGIALSAALSQTLQRRLRHVLDASPPGDPIGKWDEFIDEHPGDLPLEVEKQEKPDDVQDESADQIPPPGELKDLVGELHTSLQASGLLFERSLLVRFVASLLAKPFVIFTGLSGSGKTKLSEAFALWISNDRARSDPLLPGNEIRSSRAKYQVLSIDRTAIVLGTPQDDGTTKLTTLPRGLIEDWVRVIRDNDLTRDTSAEVIRDLVATDTNHDLHLNGFAGQLKAAAFAILEANPLQPVSPSYRIVPVGADWTSGEYVLGYPDALNPSAYVRRPALDIILSADEKPHVPHFLILDEMNLSHVERYFAEILSSIETQGRIELYSPASGARSTVPPFVEQFPKNLSVIGTVNVDETTYMFSPKVLDRANVIEFRVSAAAQEELLAGVIRLDLKRLSAGGTQYATYFDGTRVVMPLSERFKKMLRIELGILFDVLSDFGAEFGFRVSSEICSFVAYYLALTVETDVQFSAAIDAQILQKILTKVHGAERDVRPLLWGLGTLAATQREWSPTDGTPPTLINNEIVRSTALRALRLEGQDPLQHLAAAPHYALTYDKVIRMLRRLERNGYVAFAEN